MTLRRHTLAAAPAKARLPGAPSPSGLSQLPLSGNGLLRKIVAGSANKAAGLAEQKAETEKSYRYGRSSTQGPVQVMETTKPRSGPPPDWKKQALGGNGSDE